MSRSRPSHCDYVFNLYVLLIARGRAGVQGSFNFSSIGHDQESSLCSGSYPELMHTLSDKVKNLSGFFCSHWAVFIEAGVQSDVPWACGIACKGGWSGEYLSSTAGREPHITSDI